MGLEIERKFLIRLPDLSMLLTLPGVTVWEIEQIYLRELPGKKIQRRVRRIVEDGRETFIFTEKEKISKISRREEERELSRKEFAEALGEAESRLTKTRYRFPWEGHLIEIDVYPPEYGGEGLRGRAILEVELSGEDESFLIPPFLTVERELTGTKEFTNQGMAKPFRIT